MRRLLYFITTPYRWVRDYLKELEAEDETWKAFWLEVEKEERRGMMQTGTRF